jgi:hypothetical protein
LGGKQSLQPTLKFKKGPAESLKPKETRTRQANGSETGKHARANEASKSKESKEAAARGIYDPHNPKEMNLKKMHAVAVQPVALQSCKKGEEGKPYVVGWSLSCIRTQAFLAWAVQFIRFIF